MAIADADEFGTTKAVKVSIRRLPTRLPHANRRSPGRQTKSAFAHIASVGLSWVSMRVC